MYRKGLPQYMIEGETINAFIVTGHDNKYVKNLRLKV
jgi:hypothetical protein